MVDKRQDRIEALELAVTQLADAVEVLIVAVGTGFNRKRLEPVLEQVAAARRMIGTDR